VLKEVENGVGWILINREEKRNALNKEVMEGIVKILDKFERDKEIGSIVIAGKGVNFASGADIEELLNLTSLPVDEISSFLEKGKLFYDRIAKCKKPVIAAIKGYALGGGCELALASDIRIAEENAKFGLPEVKLGLLPGGGGIQRLVRIVGIGRAKRMLYTGEIIDAKRAFDIGLIDSISKEDLLFGEAQRLGEKINQSSPTAIEMIKSSIEKGADLPLDHALFSDFRSFEILLLGEDVKEGIKAFMEKRKPNFRKK